MIQDSCTRTRTRLLEAAGEIFAERGFKAATIREIVDRAGANLAAVNYHYGDKEALYREVLRSSVRNSIERFPADGGVSEDAPSPERLLGFVRNFLLRCLGACDRPDSQRDWSGRLMTREMAEPTPHLQAIIDEFMRPMVERLGGLVQQIAGHALTESDMWLCCHSIIAQCVLYKQWESVGERFHPDLLPAAPERIELLARHITRFSLAALRGLASEESL